MAAVTTENQGVRALPGEKHVTGSELVSVIIANYNYENYVGAAISSALAIDWPQVEVIVVDDGSTDGSRQIIESYMPLGIKALFIPHGGQAKAAALGYSHSRGDWIIFLDSDDLLDPSVVREAAAVMEPGWSKVQFQMKVIDSTGAIASDRNFPKYPANTTPTLIRQWATETDCYPAPPCSGNLLAREFFEKIFPLEEGVDNFVDSYFISTAPFLGKVLTVCKPLVSYRVHGKNLGAHSTLNIQRVARDLHLHIKRCTYSARIAQSFGVDVAADRWRYSFYNLAMRLASLRLAPAKHPIERDSTIDCLMDGAVSVTRGQGMTSTRHVAMVLWLLVVALGPKPVSQSLISWRFAPSSRPRFLQRLIRAA